MADGATTVPAWKIVEAEPFRVGVGPLEGVDDRAAVGRRDDQADTTGPPAAQKLGNQKIATQPITMYSAT